MATTAPPIVDPSNAFCLEVNFERGSRDPGRVFRSMYELLQVFEEVDADLARVIDARIQPVLVLEDIQAGSIRTWVRDRIVEIDDDDIRDLDWRRIVGKYLVAAKARLLRFVVGRRTLEDRAVMLPLEQDLLRLARSTSVHPLDAYTPVAPRRLIAAYQRVSTALVMLDPGDRVSYITTEEQIELNREFNISDEAAEELLVRDRIENTSEMILKVKKPDFLGSSMWELRHHDHPIAARILDAAWLREFQNRTVNVRPGDSLRARVRTIVLYDDNHEVISEKYEVLEVVGVLEAPAVKQTLLLPPRR